MGFWRFGNLFLCCLRPLYEYGNGLVFAVLFLLRYTWDWLIPMAHRHLIPSPISPPTPSVTVNVAVAHPEGQAVWQAANSVTVGVEPHPARGPGTVVIVSMIQSGTTHPSVGAKVGHVGSGLSVVVAV